MGKFKDHFIVIVLFALGAIGLFMSENHVTAAPAGGPTISIGSPLPVPVRQFEEPARSAFQVFVRGTTAQPDPVLPAVPAGKRLVIQNISARAFVNAPALGMLKLNVLPADGDFIFPMTYAGNEPPPTGNLWVGNFPTTIYIDAGTRAQFILEAPGVFPPALKMEVSVSGYLLDCTADLPCPPMAP